MKPFILDRSARGMRFLENELEMDARDEIRPEMVELGRSLAKDSTYPPFEICSEVAQSYLNSIESA